MKIIIILIERVFFKIIVSVEIKYFPKRSDILIAEYNFRKQNLNSNICRHDKTMVFTQPNEDNR